MWIQWGNSILNLFLLKYYQSNKNQILVIEFLLKDLYFLECVCVFFFIFLKAEYWSTFVEFTFYICIKVELTRNRKQRYRIAAKQKFWNFEEIMNYFT